MHVGDHRHQQRVSGHGVKRGRLLKALQQVAGAPRGKRLNIRAVGPGAVPFNRPVSPVDEVRDLAGGQAAHRDDIGAFDRGLQVALLILHALLDLILGQKHRWAPALVSG